MTTESYYNSNALEFYNNTINLDMTQLYRPFLELIKKGGHILDAGCGSGRDSKYFIEQGYQVTAFDSCQRLCQLASQLINKEVINISFHELNFSEQFDGIWACASLLHIKKEEIDDVINRLVDALIIKGVLYASFKYGDKEEIRKGRLFNCYTEESSNNLLNNHPELLLKKRWQTVDVRVDRAGEKWLNILLQKKGHA